MKNNNEMKAYSNFVIFQTSTGKVNVDVLFQNETLWLSQKGISELFEKHRTVITKHLKNTFSEGELKENVVCAKFAPTAKDGKIKSRSEYEKYQIVQDRLFESGFGKFIKPQQQSDNN